ncbi:phospholipase D family protein [Demequina sp. SYSU T00039]|uniref:Phospholipase D family protein n=1 Tax=Demequina lignilytica TaxID=3051663 RepID=A0AAW7M1U0_9MICO|nr:MULTISPECIES: phospholipase D family protein [unclassified Demequina]MDN4477306.1 phospholipase D family protein [Demequina sp. SYSU T00039-1]MDN4487479.1 phospholipase D family protein [Demequina sp. SYSU T00039]
MTLTPETRVLLTDALRPPAGFGVDVAVGTTYSMDLTALLLAPLSFALEDRLSGEDLDGADPVRLLEAVRRYADRTTVFCQAGGIHVPPNYRSILTFVEESVREVAAPRAGAIFHPKTWALRFVDESGERYLHRVLILSRNITFDRSWDTALVLDEAPDGNIDAAPMADFVSALPWLGLRPLDSEREAAIASLAGSLRAAALAAPAPFTGGELIPIGVTGDRVWPFPESAQKILAISPFLTTGGVAALSSISTKRTLITRQESLDLLGADAFKGWETNVLQRLAEIEAGADPGDAESATSEVVGTSEGLHAKTFVVDLLGGTSQVITGSANLTSARWGNNVEFDALLYGPTRECGVDRVLVGSDEAPGLIRMLEAASAVGSDPVDDPQIVSTYAIEAFHRSLAEGGMTLQVRRHGDGRVDATLTTQLATEPPGICSIWPISVPRDGHSRALSTQISWDLAEENVTPFIAVETTAGAGDDRVVRRCVLKAELTGDVRDRRKNAVATVLRNQQDVLRYLIFLLGDPAYDALLAELAGAESWGSWGDAPRGVSVDVALFEPLVRAVGRDDAALARIAGAVDELRQVDGAQGLIPAGFDELWEVVWSVHQERRA